MCFSKDKTIIQMEYHELKNARIVMGMLMTAVIVLAISLIIQGGKC